MPGEVSIDGRTFAGRRARLTLAPGPAGVTVYAPGRRPVRLSPAAVSVRRHFVYLGPPPRIRHVEHLFSVLFGLMIFDVRVRLDGREVPFFDGSGADLARALGARFRPRRRPFLAAGRSLTVRAGRSFLTYEPRPRRRLIVDLALDHRLIGRQRFRLAVTPRSFCREVAPARTFVFTGVRDPRLKDPPPYGFAVTPHGIAGRGPARYPDEAVRHKVLDLLGDLYPLGAPLAGTITGRNTFHALNHMLMKKIAGILRE